MKQSYSCFKDKDLFILTDFKCEPSKELLQRQDLYKILWSRNAAPEITIDNYQLKLKKGTVVFCTPLNVIDLSDQLEGLMAFVFNKDFFCIQTHDDQVSCHGFLFFGSSQPVTIDLDKNDFDSFEVMLAMFEEDLNVKDHLQGEMLRSTLKRMLIKSTRIAKYDLPQPKISNDHMNIVRRYNVLVEKHFREYHNVKDYANLLFKSPKTLSNIFPKYTDKSPLKIINERILLEARRLLLYSDKSAQEITNELGYRDAGHYSKFFKKHEGLAPSLYKKERIVNGLNK